MDKVVDFISKVMVAAAPVIKGLESAKPYAQFIMNSVQNDATEVSDAELATLLAGVQAQSELLQRPLDPE